MCLATPLEKRCLAIRQNRPDSGPQHKHWHSHSNGQRRKPQRKPNAKQADYTRLRGELKLDNFDGDSGGGLMLKGVDVESDGGLARDSDGKLALKFGDDDLQPQITRVSVNTGAANLPAPNTDTMVVDLRGTPKTSVDPALLKNDTFTPSPEQLPKSIDDALLAAYAEAPPGVSDRVRKGFQAIAEHDWIIALACFQDALNKNPGDPGLKRLVDLAQFTLDYRRHKCWRSGIIPHPRKPFHYLIIIPH